MRSLGPSELQAERKTDSKALDRSYVELFIEGKSGKLTRKEAIATAAQQLGVNPETVGLIRLEGHSGSSDLLGRFYVYGSLDSKKRLHPRYLEERTLTQEERDKLKQERKKAATPAPAPEAKK
jgi:ribosomal protein S24E